MDLFHWCRRHFKGNCSIASFNVSADLIKSEYIASLRTVFAVVNQHSPMALAGALPICNFQP